MFKRITTLICTAILATFAAKSKYVICDLGNFLVKPNKLRSSHYIGWRRFAGYAIKDFKNPANIDQILFKVLTQLGEQKAPSNGIYATYCNKKLPAVMCDWFAGKLPGNEIMAKVHEKTEELFQQNFFTSSRERAIVDRIVTLMFDPELLTHYTKIKKRGLRLIKKLAQHHDLYILSNWDRDSFELLFSAKNTQKLFRYFKRENIVISAEAGTIKPFRDIYRFFLNRYRLKGDECVFFDDQEENVIGAQEAGIQLSFLLHNDDYKLLEKQLQQAGIL